jgi:hypothetical protein
LIYVYGGYSASQGMLSDMYRLDPRADKFKWEKLTARGDLPGKRGFHSCTLLEDTLVLFGGQDRRGHSVNLLHTYHIPTRLWIKLPAENSPCGLDSHCSIIQKATHTLIVMMGFCTNCEQ